MKTCDACNHEKPLTDFSKRANSSDGRRNTCKECRKEAGLGYASTTTQTYAQRIIAVLKNHNEPMWIDDLRAAFKSTRAEKEGISSALRSLADRGEITVTGGMAHRNSRKMISIVPVHYHPTGARIVRLTDTWRHDTALISSGVRMQSSMQSLIMMLGE